YVVGHDGAMATAAAELESDRRRLSHFHAVFPRKDYRQNSQCARRDYVDGAMMPFVLDDAAAAALWAIQNAPREHIGLLYEQDGTIRATPTQTRNNAGRTKGSFEIPAGSLRGIFHNHPPPKQQRRGSML